MNLRAQHLVDRLVDELLHLYEHRDFNKRLISFCDALLDSDLSRAATREHLLARIDGLLDSNYPNNSTLLGLQVLQTRLKEPENRLAVLSEVTKTHLETHTDRLLHFLRWLNTSRKPPEVL